MKIKQKNNNGFTLIELMIVVAIIAVIAAIAIPQYKQFVLKSRRVAAQADLMELGAYLERYYTTNNKYTAATLPFLASRNGTAYYNYTLPTATATTYSLTATPTTAGDQSSELCGTLTINSVGAKTPTAVGCW